MQVFQNTPRWCERKRRLKSRIWLGGRENERTHAIVTNSAYTTTFSNLDERKRKQRSKNLRQYFSSTFYHVWILPVTCGPRKWGSLYSRASANFEWHNHFRARFAFDPSTSFPFHDYFRKPTNTQFIDWTVNQYYCRVPERSEIN